MLMVACDVETNPIPATVLHCIVAINVDTMEEHVFREGECTTKFPTFAATVDHWVFQNGISFDAPVLARITGVRIPLSKITDTMILSQLQEPDREGGHSLKAWGEFFKMYKGDFATGPDGKVDVSKFNHYSEDMVDYCIQDTRITVRVYKYLKKLMSNFSESSVRLEHQVRSIVTQQELNGFPFDIEGAIKLLAVLEEKKDTLEKEVHEEFKPLPVYSKTVELIERTKAGQWPKNKLKCLGEANVDLVDGSFSLVDWPDFNLGSRQQIAKHLIFHGWKPTKTTDKGSIIVDEDVLEGVDIPQAQMIATYLMLQKRIAQIGSWVTKYEEDNDGSIHGSVITIGAVSNRMAHHSPNIAQVPASKSPYGKECRSLFTSGVSDGSYVLFGTDASGLELRCLAHYIDDPDYTNEILSGDIHTKNMLAAGLTEREQAKTFIYAWLYGAGAAKIGSIVGGSSKDGKKLIDSFLTSVPAIARLKARVSEAAKKSHIKALDGRLLKIRSPHAALNQLLQGMGAIVCKQWLLEITKLYRHRKLDVKLVASIHDEYQFIVHKDHVEAMSMVVKEAMKKTEAILNVKCPLDCERSVGNNWAETH